MKQMFESWGTRNRDLVTWRNKFECSYRSLLDTKARLESLITEFRSPETTFEQKLQVHRKILSYIESVRFEENRINNYKQCQLTYYSTVVSTATPGNIRDERQMIYDKLLMACEKFDEELRPLHSEIFNIQIESDMLMRQLETEQIIVRLMSQLGVNHRAHSETNSTEESASPGSQNSIFGSTRS